jgi:hypothetical protein
MQRYSAIVVLLLFASISVAQITADVVRTPIISTKLLTCGITSANDTITSSAAFASTVVGQRVVGTGIPFGTVIGTKISTSALKLSNAATATNVSALLHFGYFDSVAYDSLDAFGFPDSIVVTLPFPKRYAVLKAIIITDADKQSANYEVVFFNARYTAVADSSAWTPSDADAKNVVHRILVSNFATDGANSTAIASDTNVPFVTARSGNTSTLTLYYQLVARSTTTPTAVNSVQVRFRFDYN